jgi:hypothetical protein
MPKKTAGVHALSGGARAKKSIDYAVMEATNLAALAPTDLGWSASADLIVCAASPANEGSLVDLIVSLTLAISRLVAAHRPRAEDEVGARVAQKAMSQICGAEHASHIYLNLGDIPHRSQLSIRRSGTRENSRSLSVTIVCPNANA